MAGIIIGTRRNARTSGKPEPREPHFQNKRGRLAKGHCKSGGQKALQKAPTSLPPEFYQKPRSLDGSRGNAPAWEKCVFKPEAHRSGSILVAFPVGLHCCQGLSMTSLYFQTSHQMRWVSNGAPMAFGHGPLHRRLPRLSLGPRRHPLFLSPKSCACRAYRACRACRTHVSFLKFGPGTPYHRKCATLPAVYRLAI